MLQSLDPDVLRSANINPETGLATDYLNHFAEVAMLVGMLDDMPDMAEAVLDWGPVSYPEHFCVTGFRERDLAILAWEHAPPGVRASFETACRTVEAAIADVQARLRNGPDAAAGVAAEGQRLFELIAGVSGVIAGSRPQIEDAAASQADVDSHFADAA